MTPGSTRCITRVIRTEWCSSSTSGTPTCNYTSAIYNSTQEATRPSNYKDYYVVLLLLVVKCSGITGPGVLETSEMTITKFAFKEIYANSSATPTEMTLAWSPEQHEHHPTHMPQPSTTSSTRSPVPLLGGSEVGVSKHLPPAAGLAYLPPFLRVHFKR